MSHSHGPYLDSLTTVDLEQLALASLAASLRNMDLEKAAAMIDAVGKEMKRLRTRVAELEAAQTQP